MNVSLGAVLRAVAKADPADVADMVAAAATEIGASDVVLYLVDFAHQFLEPLPDRAGHHEVPHEEPVGTSLAGRAFTHCTATTAERPDGARVFVPILEGSEPTGVLGVTVAIADDETIGTCLQLGVLAGYLIATHARVTDAFSLRRRRKHMTLAASMQWDLLPPLCLQSHRVSAAGMVEPAYEVGGDGFDYALNGPFFHFSILDSMGHGLKSAVAAGLAMGCYRHHRREGRSLRYMHDDIDASLSEEFDGSRFVTGLLGRLEADSGLLEWLSAGHPAPLLIRRGRVVGPLETRPSVPWGLGPDFGEVGTVPLEPGDSVLLYTDGVIEARGAGTRPFGIERLADLAGQHASEHLPLGLIVRLIVQAVLEHHGDRLRDDATVLLVQWTGPQAFVEPFAERSGKN